MYDVCSDFFEKLKSLESPIKKARRDEVQDGEDGADLYD